MKISYDEIERIKTLNLPQLITDYGIRPSSSYNGSYSFFCPFHEDKNPSLKVNLKGKKWLWHCFGCDLGGNIINFVMKYENLTLKQAYNKLISLNGRYKSALAESSYCSAPDEPNLSAEAQKLLNRVIEFYHTSFYEDKRALSYLTNQRHIHDKGIFQYFRIGYANGTLDKVIPQKGEVVKLLRALGILSKGGKEHFLDCCIFPVFDDKGNCVEIYGRRITDTEPKHLYLKGEHRGVFNHHIAKTNQTLILTEGIIDCLSVYQAGFKNCIPLYGTNGLTKDHIALFENTGTKEAYLCLDRDEAGRRASLNLKDRLLSLGITTYIIELPDGMDANEYFKVNEPLNFERLLKESNPAQTQQSEVTLKQGEETIERLKDGLFIQYAARRYFIRGIDHSNHQKLRVNIKAVTDKRFHIDTVDLYVSKQRKNFAKEAGILFKEEAELIEHDLNRIIEKIEEYIQNESDLPSKAYLIPDKEKEEALKFLKDPNLANIILKDFETVGCAGEQTNKLIGYLTAVSRKLDDPLSILILSRSAAGKSFLQESILELVPGEDRYKYTRITHQALFYKGENSLQHKVIGIEEEEGANEAAYSIRTMQSSKLLSIATTIKDPLTGSMKTQEYQVKGPLSIILTTTRADIDYETMSRFIVLSIDETRQQTHLIHSIQREKETLTGILKQEDKNTVIKKHRNAQRLLKPVKVVNPYAKLLTYIDDRLRARRDHKKYLNIIKAVAYLFQYQRPVKQIEYKGKIIEYIEVTLEDIHLANKIAHEILGRSLDELSPPSRKLLSLIKALAGEIAEKEHKKPNEVHFSRKDIREYTKWSDYQVRHHLNQLVDLEYVLITSGRNGSRFIYELIYDGQGEDGSAFLIGLTNIEDLRKKAKRIGLKTDLEGESSGLAPSLSIPCTHLAG